MAVCQDIIDEDIEVVFLKICEGNDNDKNQVFRMDESDKAFISEDQIIEVLEQPDLILKGIRIFYKFSKEINVFESV